MGKTVSYFPIHHENRHCFPLCLGYGSFLHLLQRLLSYISSISLWSCLQSCLQSRNKDCEPTMFPPTYRCLPKLLRKLRSSRLSLRLKANVDFVICALLLLKTFPNVPLFAPKEKMLVWTLAKLERPLALLVESFKFCNFHFSWLK